MRLERRSIISGPSEESTDKYYKVNRIIPALERGEVIEGKEPGENTPPATLRSTKNTAPWRSPNRAF